MAFVPLTEAECNSGEPVKTTTMNKLRTNLDDHELRIQAAEAGSAAFPAIIMRVNGRYDGLGVLDAILKTTVSTRINIIGVRILIDVAGIAGDTEIDIKVKRVGEGTWTSIMSVLPSANYTDGDNYLSDSGTLDEVEAIIEPGDVLRLDQTAVQEDGRSYLVRIDWNRTFPE